MNWDRLTHLTPSQQMAFLAIPAVAMAAYFFVASGYILLGAGAFIGMMDGAAMVVAFGPGYGAWHPQTRSGRWLKAYVDLIYRFRIGRYDGAIKATAGAVILTLFALAFAWMIVA